MMKKSGFMGKFARSIPAIGTLLFAFFASPIAASGAPEHSQYKTSHQIPASFGVGEYVEAEAIIYTHVEGNAGYSEVNLELNADGEGDVIISVFDDNGYIDTVKNSGTVPVSSLAANDRQTIKLAIKASQPGKYKLDYAWKAASTGKAIVKDQAKFDVFPGIQHLGPQITGSVRIGVSAFGYEADGRAAMFTVVQGDPGMFVVVDVRTEQTIKQIPIPGASGSWAVTVASDGSVYVGTWHDGGLYRYVPGSDTLETVGKSITGTTLIWHLVPGKDGKVFMGTYHNNRVVEYDPQTGTLTDLGDMYPGELNVKQVAYNADDNVIYAGIGQSAHLVELNLSTGQKRDILPESLKDQISVYDLQYAAGKLFVRMEPDFKVRVIDKETLQIDAEFSAQSRGVSPLSPDGSKVFYIDSRSLYSYDLNTKRSELVKSGIGGSATGWDFVRLNDPDYPGYTLAATSSNSTSYFLYNLETGATKISNFSMPPQAIKLSKIAAGPDGKIYSGGFLAGGASVYDPAAGTSSNLGAIGQSEAIQAVGRKLYFGVYPSASLYEYDPSKGWGAGNPVQRFTLYDSHGQLRPVAIAGSETHQRVFVGTTPHEGRLGGALTEYRMTDGSFAVHTVSPDQSVISLAYLNGKIYAGTSIYGGSGASPATSEGKLLIWDIETGRIEREMVPVPGVTAVIALTAGKDGRIWGLAQNHLFIYDPAEQKIVYEKPIFDPYEVKIFGAELKTAENGTIYGTVLGKLFRIDPKSKQLSVIKENGVSSLAIDRDENVYYASDSQLYRYTVHDQSVRPEEIRLDQTSLTLKVGEIALLDAQVRPAFADSALRFSSSNSTVASVNASGQIVGEGPGNAAITVSSRDGRLSAVLDVLVEEIPELYVLNSGFEQVAADGTIPGWDKIGTGEVSTEKQHSGNNSLKVVDNTASNPAVKSKLIPIPSGGVEYEVSAAGFLEQGGGFNLMLFFFDANGNQLAPIYFTAINGLGEWRTYTVSGLAPEDAEYVQIVFATSKSTQGVAYFDDVTLR
jgi:WD40 repeat protein